MRIDGVLPTKGEFEAADLVEPLDKWRGRVGLPDVPSIVAALRSGKGGGRRRFFVPVTTDGFAPVGDVELNDAAKWVFLPLEPVWNYVDAAKGAGLEKAEAAVPSLELDT